MSPEDLSLLVRALAFAAGKHRDQRRKDLEASPYINHPIALTNVLVNEGGLSDAATLCAAILHDTIEDTETTPDELSVTFGDEITGIVMEVTDDKTQPKEARKKAQIDHAPHLSVKAIAVKLADKICNLRDITQSPPAGWSQERRQQYFDWAWRVIDGLRGDWPELEAVFEQALGERPVL